MASQRSRAPRGGARGGAHESGEEAQLWAEIREQLEKIKKHEDRAKDLRAQIFDMETKLKSQQDSEISKSRQRPFDLMFDRLV
jgi:SAGA-associated factor 29